MRHTNHSQPSGRPKRLRNSLRQERLDRGLSRKQVAKILSMSPSAIAKLEKGYRKPPLVTALKLQIIYRSQVAAFYLDLYHELASQIREREGQIRRPRKAA